MPYATSVQQHGLPWAHESTRLRPSLDSDDVRQQWKRNNTQRNQLQEMAVGQQQLSRQLESIRRRILGGAGNLTSTVYEGATIAQYAIVGITNNNATIYASPGTVLVNGQNVVPHFILVQADPGLSGFIVSNPTSPPPLPCLIPYKLWAIPTETIDTSNVVTYSAYNDSVYGNQAQTRTASATIGGSPVNEIQVIVPRYLVGDVISCLTISSPILSPQPDPSQIMASGGAMLLDINVDGRAWAIA
jgi:hypothetical protein